jgi:phosphate starvation-inducible PhoH-like protein
MKKRTKTSYTVDKNLSMTAIQPITKNQELVFKHYRDGHHIIMSGCAGTGKTFQALSLALRDVITTRNFEKIIIIRSSVQARSLGYLPGNEREKMEVYEAPYESICKEIFCRGDSYQIMKNKGLIEFQSTSFLRGMTFSGCIVILEEAQNCNFHEIETVVTRIGEDCKLIVTGDIRQSDLYDNKKENISGFDLFVHIAKDMEQFKIVDFKYDDIVRSSFVKDFIIAVDKHYKTNYPY